MVATLQGWGLGRGQAAAAVGVTVWLVGLLSVLSFSTLADVKVLFGMNVFELVTTIPPEIFLPVGGALIAVFAAWVLPEVVALRALDAGPTGFRVWRTLVRWVSIPLTLVVLVSGLI